ncbi:conserved hypothetical protein [uncultured delta proteobacterium]|uniref:Uncharacterized protein n=1 Tax=uncultured delta proteobacterium TaxID=34034 RepID=A0A212KHB9_9DELT|nr:conserved hypothetical protein [uncultured delta proteobacterium]
MNLTGSSISFLYLPIDGVAAYWLSLRKLLGNARNMKALEAETQFVGEPLVRHLLDMLIMQVAPERFRQLAETCGKGEIDRLDRQFDLMRVAVMDMATGENPLRTLAKMTAHFPAPLTDPEGMLESAQANLAAALNGTLPPEVYRVDHHMADQALAATLLFYATLCRRHGKAACRSFLPQDGSLFFTDALSLVVDGFDAPFIRKWMKKYKHVLLNDMQRKIALSADMCAAIQNRMPFEEMRFLVRSYIR